MDFQNFTTSLKKVLTVAALGAGCGLSTLAINPAMAQQQRPGSCYRPDWYQRYDCSFGGYDNPSYLSWTNGSEAYVKLYDARGNLIKGGYIDSNHREFQVPRGVGTVRFILEPSKPKSTTHFVVVW